MSDATTPTPVPATDWLAIAPAELAALAAPVTPGVAPGLLDGVCVGPWQLRALIGVGGMGEVYRAEHVERGELAAVKLLRAAPWLAGTGLARFRREARVAAAIAHPNVVPVLDVGEAAGTWWLALGLVEGHSLQRWVDANGPLPWRLALRAVAQAACGLQAAHDNCIVHRDVKPANIVLGHDGRAQVTDFGIAHDDATGGGLTLTGQAVGTPAYMSPEQCTGARVDARADLYALGATLYFCVTGQPPFAAEAAAGALALLEAQVRTPAPRADARHADVPGPVADVIAMLLAKSPDARYQTAAAFVADAVSVLAGEPPALAGGDDTSVRYTRAFADAETNVDDAAVEACLAEQAQARARGERPAPLGELLARRGTLALAGGPTPRAAATTPDLRCPACDGRPVVAAIARPLPTCPHCHGSLEAADGTALGEAYDRLVCVPPAGAPHGGADVVPLLAAAVEAGWAHAAVDTTDLGRLAEHATIWITDALEVCLAAGGSLALVVPEARTRALLAAVGIDQYVRVVDDRTALAAVAPPTGESLLVIEPVPADEPTPVP